MGDMDSFMKIFDSLVENADRASGQCDVSVDGLCSNLSHLSGAAKETSLYALRAELAARREVDSDLLSKLLQGISELNRNLCVMQSRAPLELSHKLPTSHREISANASFLGSCDIQAYLENMERKLESSILHVQREVAQIGAGLVEADLSNNLSQLRNEIAFVSQGYLPRSAEGSNLRCSRSD